MKQMWCAALLAALALAACTEDATSTGRAEPPSPSTSAPTGYDLSPNHFTQVLMCGNGMAPRAGTVSGRQPCERFDNPTVVQALERELLMSQPVPSEEGCVGGSQRLVLTLTAAGQQPGLRLPSVEVLIDCRLARRPGSDNYFALTDAAQELLLRLAADTA